MWIPITLIVGLSITLFLPKIIISLIFEVGKIRDGKLLCRYPNSIRILLWIGVSLFSVLVVFIIENGLKTKMDIFLLALMSVIDFILILLCYICMQYKILMDINQQKIIVYKLCLLKREIPFLDLFKSDEKQLIWIKDKENKKLFSYSTYMSGGRCLGNCLNIIIKNNRNGQPINISELQRLFRNENNFLKK